MLDGLAPGELVAVANELGMLLAGPNGQGIVSTPAALCAQMMKSHASATLHPPPMARPLTPATKIFSLFQIASMIRPHP